MLPECRPNFDEVARIAVILSGPGLEGGAIRGELVRIT